MKHSTLGLSLALALFLGACTTTTIDEYRRDEASLSADKSIVVLGRRHVSGKVTEPFIVNCIGKQLSSGRQPLSVVSEQEFQDRLYPWFEPRTAPLQLPALQSMLAKPVIAEEVKKMGLQYIVWIDGKTVRGDSAGGISCAVGVGGAGCLGFGTWDDDGNYEVSVWDIAQDEPVAEMKVKAEGTSYMPAVVVPVPLIARVKSSVCNGLSQQIKTMFPE